MQFSARALDRLGNEIVAAKIEWSSTGGSINEFGVFKAGPEEGTVRVTASLGGTQGVATIAIVNEIRKLARLAIHPSEAHLTPGKTLSFTAKGFDQHGQEIPLGRVEWEAMGGEINDQGFFHAGMDEGCFFVTASAGDLKGTSKVVIKKVKAHWSGEMPHQKWSQFYTRVLMKHVAGNKLKLTIDMDLSDVTEEDIEQIRIALKELGLDDDVEVA